MAINKKRPRTVAAAGGMDKGGLSPMPAVKTRRGARVAQARHKAGLSQEQLAKRIGTARSTVARVEIGFTTPTLDLALALSDELGVSVEALFGNDR
jgi:DNA-binding XRE family transcriptional regulator